MNNMNPMGMNQMPMFPMGMNPFGMNNTGINMDATAQNVRDIIQPYENKIRELEEIIKNKDFEIALLKQQLKNANNNNQINMNQMNMMNFNPMNMMGNIQQKEKGFPITLTIKSEFNPNINTVNCFPLDKASVIREKCNFGGMNENGFYLTHRYHLIRENLSIIDNDIREDSPIYLSTYLYQLRFKTGYGRIFTVRLEGNCPIGVAIIIFFVKFFLN